MKKKKLKQIYASAHLVQYRFKIRGGSPEGCWEQSTQEAEHEMTSQAAR